VNRSDHTPLPTRLRVVGATDLERRVLDAAARELPSVELTEKMQKALGISIAAGTLAAAAKALAAKSSGAASASVPAFAWSAISVGVLALAVTGAVVGLRSNTSHHAASSPATAVAPAPAMAPIISTRAAPAVSSPAVGGSPAVGSPAVAAPGFAAQRPVLVARATERPAAAVHARHHRAVATSSDLRAEIALVDAARTAVATGADDRALALLQRYDGSYPAGTFRPETSALRIEALDHLGRTAQARTLASKFIATHADSPLADRVARLTGVQPR
jgi:hypothetical protein